MTFDPRGHRRYRETRARWLRTANPVCHLCGEHVDTTLPYGHPGAATVEHTLPVRMMTGTRQQILDQCCDTSLWRVAHARCQGRQGQRVTTRIVTGPVRSPSRVW